MASFTLEGENRFLGSQLFPNQDIVLSLGRDVDILKFVLIYT